VGLRFVGIVCFGALLIGCSDRARGDAEPLVCLEGASVQIVEYSEEHGGGYGERCALPDGTRHGPSRDWYVNGVMATQTYWIKGERDGKSLMWHPNGVKSAETEHRRWKSVGKWTNWDDEGKVISEYDFGSAEDGASEAAPTPAADPSAAQPDSAPSGPIAPPAQ